MTTKCQAQEPKTWMKMKMNHKNQNILQKAKMEEIILKMRYRMNETIALINKMNQKQKIPMATMISTLEISIKIKSCCQIHCSKILFLDNNIKFQAPKIMNKNIFLRKQKKMRFHKQKFHHIYSRKMINLWIIHFLLKIIMMLMPEKLRIR